MNMRPKENVLFIRADASQEIGVGHVMRCIALAQVWQEQGGRAFFLTHCDSNSLRQRIIAEGFGLSSIEMPHPHPSDLAKTLSVLTPKKKYAINQVDETVQPWLALDGYHFTSDYQKAIRDADARLLLFDDMNHLSHYHADILLNQNIYAPDLHYNCNTDAILLLGTRYVLLRREFLKYRDFKRMIPGKAKNILVTMGGSDPDNVTLKVIEAIKLVNDPSLEVQVVVGPSNPHEKAIRNTMHDTPCVTHLSQNTTNMPELMDWADIAITAGGSTCWELAFMGVPALISILAENQRLIVEELDRSSVACNLGHFSLFSADRVAKILVHFLNDHYKLLEMSQKAMRIVEGFGREKVFSLMKEWQ